MLAQFSDELAQGPLRSVLDVARSWSARFWAAYTHDFEADIDRLRRASAEARETRVRAGELEELRRALVVGFCIAGHVPTDRKPEAYELIFQPTDVAEPEPEPLRYGEPRFWGVPNIVNRVVGGIDVDLADAITSSPHWTGSSRDLSQLAAPFWLSPPQNLLIREAYDYVHSVIATTCKGIKFSYLPPVCGGPVELAAITADRRFRWVRHKTLGEALDRG